jgi:hypothetical protein
VKKIPSLFVRNHEGDGKVRDEVLEVSRWVTEGQGTATRKWDGMAVLIQDGIPFRRYDAKTGRTPPADFMPAQPEPDPVSGHWPGWLPVAAPADRAILESLAWARTHMFPESTLPDGTYEAVGPLIGTRHGPNPEGLSEQILVAHGRDVLDAPHDYVGLMAFLADKSIEGIVWHHPDGRMAKIKKADFPGLVTETQATRKRRKP